MRCEEVIRELMAPVSGQDLAAVNEHLERCSACAEWSARMSAFDRFWDRTRPADPSPEAWDAVWNRLERAFDESQNRTDDRIETRGLSQTPHVSLGITPGSLTYEGRRSPVADGSRPRGISHIHSLLGTKRLPAFAAAIAAAVLVAICLPFLGVFLRNQGNAVGIAASLTIDSVDIEPGQLVVIRSAETRVAGATSVIEIIHTESDDQADSFEAVYRNGDVESMYDMFNEVESMPKPVVAVR